MGDSVQVLNNTNIERLHAPRPQGKLHRGHNVTAATSSIPSKYQTIVIDNSDRKGFNARSRRFNHDLIGTENPGPGSYVSHHAFDQKSSSYSKKGTGGFASKDKRLFRHSVPAGPGTGHYGLPSMLTTVKDFNQGGATSAFHLPIAKKLEKASDVPSPNSYNVDTGTANIRRANNVAADAAFKSRSKREVINVAESQKMPAPWQYNVKDDAIKAGDKAPVSCFKSKSKRQMASTPPAVPGPGAYKPFEEIDPVQKTVFPRKHYLCISAPAMPLPKTPPPPGPGSYELVDYEGPTKHYMSGAAFVSTTSRWIGGGAQLKDATAQPGPAHYRPQETKKQSFIYNATNRWI